MDQNILTQERLKELLHYSIISGKIYWMTQQSNSIKINSIAGHAHKNGYRRIKIDGRTYTAHRLAFLYVLGRFPIDGVDHLNHDKSDNRWLNLRECTHQENAKNQKLRTNNTSGINGVSFYKPLGKWVAQLVNRNGKKIHAGYYLTKEEAAKARKQADIVYGFHSNHGQKENGK